MKSTISFFTIVISLLLLSSIILTGCMHAIAANDGEMKDYDLNVKKTNNNSSSQNIVEEDAPTEQTELQKKFNAYLHKDGNSVTVFTEEQYAELKAVRENDNRIPLTYEEILFLVNDSINMYFTYDEIILTNCNRDHVTPILNEQSFNARIITPEYRNATSFGTYSEAEIAYYNMLSDIYEIIYYRIYMHDAGFETVYHTWHSDKDNIFGKRYYGNLGMIDSAIPQGYYQMLAIDNATFSGIENEEKLCSEYKTLLEWKRMFEANNVIEQEHSPYLNSAVLYTSILNTVRTRMEYKLYIAGPKDTPAQQIYPTAELENMMPYQDFVYQANASEVSNQATFSLNYENGTVAMSESVFTSFAMFGTFEEHDGVLKMYFENYSYVFYKHEKGYIYSADNSKPAFGGFNFADGLVFETVHEGVSTNPIIINNPPVNSESDYPANSNDKSVYEMQYFKLDIYGNSCSLSSSDGNVSIDGTYTQEGDAYILSFDGDFQYVFYRNSDEYVYAKGESIPIPGYEFEDEKLFVLDGDALTPVEE